jgi:hypothetical protein
MPGFEVDRPDAIERFRDYAMNYAPEAVQNDAGRAATMTLLRVAGDYGLGFCAAVDVLCEPDGWNDTKASPPWDEGELLELAETLEPSRERPIGCDHPSVLFDTVEIEVEPPTPEEKARTRLFWRRFDAASDRALTVGDQIVRGYLDRGGMSVMYGDSNTGKTFIALDISYHIACRKEWNGRKVNGGVVVYVAAEAGESVNARIRALKQRYKPEHEPALAVVPCLVNLYSPNADLAPLLALLKEVAESYRDQIVMVVLDTLARVMGPGDENAARDMGMLVQAIDRIRVATGAHVMVVHHSGKNKANGARGSSALRAATDTELEIEGSKIIMRKQRNGEVMPSVPFRLMSVDIGENNVGESVTSCTVDLGASVSFEIQLPPEHQGWLDDLADYAKERQNGEAFKFTTKELIDAWGLLVDADVCKRPGQSEKRAARRRADVLCDTRTLTRISASIGKETTYVLTRTSDVDPDV